MSTLSGIGVTICYICVAVSIISVMIPQKRTRKIMSFVIGLFLIASILTAVTQASKEFKVELPHITEDADAPVHSEDEYTDTVAQMTADNLTRSMKELLQNEGIAVNDIRLTLKISEEGRISVVRAVIYIDEAFENRKGDIESIIYRNLSKEPEIYVQGQETHTAVE